MPGPVEISREEARSFVVLLTSPKAVLLAAALRPPTAIIVERVPVDL